jgi:hypothetical protein
LDSLPFDSLQGIGVDIESAEQLELSDGRPRSLEASGPSPDR